MNRFKLLILLLGLSIGLNASDLYEVTRDGKCGCQDDFLSLIIPMDFYYIDCSSTSNLYPVLNDQGWFYYNLETKSIENPGEYLLLSKFVENTALAYTLDSVHVLDQKFNRLFGGKKGELDRLGESEFFAELVDGHKIILDRKGKRVDGYIGSDFIKKGKYLLVYGINHFPYYRGDSVENYIHEETLIDFESGDTIYSADVFENIEFLSDDIIAARKDDGFSHTYFVINLILDQIIYESKANEYLEFPIVKDYRLFKVVNHESDIVSTYNFEGSLLNRLELDDAVYIPEVDLTLTDKDFESYLIEPDGDTLYRFEDWVLTREYDFTFWDHRTYIYGDKLLVTVDSSMCIFDPVKAQLRKLDHLTYEKIMYTSLYWKYNDYILLAEDVSLNDSLSNLGIYYLYRVYDLKNEEFYTEAFTDYEEIGDGMIRMENQERVSYFEFRQYLKTSSYYKSNKVRKSNFPYRQSLQNTVLDSTDIGNSYKISGYTITIDSSADYVYNKEFEGYLVSITNLTGEDQVVNTQDGRISLRTEVFYKDQWLPIDFMQSSWCGNSYFEVTMRNESTWNIVMPKYSGHKTGPIRICLAIYKDGKEQEYYSQSFEGSYNTSQLLDLENKK